MRSITKKINKGIRVRRNKTSKHNIRKRTRRNMTNRQKSVNENKQKHVNHMNVDNKKEKNFLFFFGSHRARAWWLFLFNFCDFV